MSGASLFSLSMDFTEAAKNGFEFSSEIAHLVIADVVKTAVGVSIGSYLTHKLLERKTRKAILEGDFSDDHAVFGDTSYLPSGIINLVTGEEFIDQRMRTFHDIELEKVFQGPHKITLMDYLMKAAEHCTSENPVVFAHLDKVIKNPEELERTKRAMSQYWVNYFSTMLGGNFERAKMHKGPREVPIERRFIPVLTKEQNALIKKFRVFLIEAEDLGNYDKIDPRNLRLEIGGGFTYDPDHNYMQRLETYKQIENVLSNEGKWIAQRMAVSEPTGAYRTVGAAVVRTGPPPAMA